MRKIPSLVLILILSLLAAYGVHARTHPSADQVGVFALEKTSQARDLGVGWTRLPLNWARFEKNKEGFNRHLKALKGVKVIVTIRATHPRKLDIPSWAKAYAMTHPGAGKTVSCPPKDIEEYKRFVREVVRKYKDKVAAWQIENEIYFSRKFWIEDEQWSVQEFIPVLKAASQVIREEDPGKPILAPGIAFIKVKFDSNGNFVRFTGTKADRTTQEKVLAAWTRNVRMVFSEGRQCFDVVDVHLYDEIEDYYGKVMWVKRMMKETDCEKPIWATEISGPKLTNLKNANEKFRRDQARELGPRLQTALDAGVEKVFYFLYRDGTSNPNDIIYTTCGLVTKDGRKKPAYKAMQEFMGRP